MRNPELQLIGGKRQFIVGLFWQPHDDIEISSDELRDKATRHEASGVVDHRARQKITIGYDRRIETDPLTPALALVALDSLQSNWVGLFELNDKYWLGAAMNGHPYPLADRLFDGEDQKEEAIEALDEIRGLLGVSNVYAPAHFHIDGTEEFDLADLNEPSSETFIRNPEPSAFSQVMEFTRINSKKITAAAALVLVSIGGYNGVTAYLDHKNAAALRITQREQQIASDNERQNKLRKEASDFRLAWETLPMPSQHMELCRDAMRKLSRPVAGWSNETPACENSTVSIVKTRSWGTPKRIYTLSERWGAEPIILDSNKASISTLWTIGDLRGEQELVSEDNSQLALRNWATEAAAQVDFNSTRQHGEIPGTETTVKVTHFILRNIRDIEALSGFLDAVSGLGLTAARKSTDGKWEVEGLVYHV